MHSLKAILIIVVLSTLAMCQFIDDDNQTLTENVEQAVSDRQVLLSSI